MLLYTRKPVATQLAVALPGARYSIRKPLLRYSIELLLKHGYQVLAWDKVYGDDVAWRNLSSEAAARKVVEDDHAQVFGQIEKKFGKVDVLMGRSLGTYAIACRLEREIVKPKNIIWQTPALGQRWTVMGNCKIRGLGVIGTADHYFEQAIKNLPKDRLVVEGADYTMEIPGDTIRSIEILQQVMVATDTWLKKIEA